MKLTFLGTRGGIEARTRRHRMHTSLLVSYRGARVVIDCRLGWAGKLGRLHPDAIVRKRDNALIGHAAISAQLGWCAKEGVPRVIITHCGSEIVNGDERKLSVKLRAMAAERGVEAAIAYDGMELILR